MYIRNDKTAVRLVFFTKCRKDYFDNGSLPAREDYLRTGLFILQRSIRFASRDEKPYKEDWDYINAILDKLRKIKRESIN
ncbi:hypothetical protein LJ207_12140 [Halanaerobium sp. Z-7514]|uniref:Uncharacterized protein n=1 Tax=Halanaerobium polyolivorans TaxID=2886943 RepID=A0AAW4X2L3_9FIRM|nr:hypothetical protein [Halanaerobium polyolivorans]MCC3146061.1 hypothetical protein [Halanaerobium polyolivorans]